MRLEGFGWQLLFAGGLLDHEGQRHVLEKGCMFGFPEMIDNPSGAALDRVIDRDDAGWVVCEPG